MNATQIRKVCITACKTYTQFLTDKGGGVYRISVNHIEPVGKDKFKLVIQGKIFDEETLLFKHVATNKSWDVAGIKIQVYDRDKNLVVIKPNTESYQFFAENQPKDWEILSDMKFLIERVQKWYETNGASLKLPHKKPVISAPSNSFFFTDLHLPSSEQQEALNLIFNTPFSYIWGAPGTGKTQYVLSYAILNYLKHNKKVAIVAPTNHALEQIFRGVVKMTDKAGISRDAIIRLGGPSKKFADEFPEICEIIGLENELKKIRQQLSVLQNILGIDEQSNNIKLLQKALEDIKVYQAKEEKLLANEKSLQSTKANLKSLASKAIEYDLKLKEFRIERERLKKKQNSALVTLVTFFGKRKNYQELIDHTIQQEAEYTIRKNEIDSTIEKYSNELKIKEDKLAEGWQLAKDVLIKVKTAIQAVDYFANTQVITDRLKNLEKDLKKFIEESNDSGSVYESIGKEYAHHSKEELYLKLESLKNEEERLINYSTEERLKNVSIIGATLDTYLYRFKEDKLNVHHIFLDEAGYSNVIKAQTLFNQDTPVTFLGDHMQLPPVCEISQRDIQQNENYREVLVWDQSAIFIEDLYKQDSLIPVLNRYLNKSKPEFVELKKENLTITHRFGNRLANVLEKFVYPEGFSSGLSTETAIIILDVKNPPQYRNSGRKNESEIRAIKNLIENNFSIDSNMAVLAPYAAQVRGLASALPEYNRENKILTVHKSQGQEWDTVIYSVCDIGNGKRPWFTASDIPMSSGLNNINTAISRAKKQLIVVCDKESWLSMNGQFIKGILEVATLS
ncbi:AAA domain-containing protein [Zunongwangia pacifica]|uniref:AAA domain-containing protein n=1 Tax=Zunongwangia pacifica TaxID=2911062 RepID=A0A9X2CMA1_9FLAO|nr:AAA domain-containing protein [Zunongwangia pacifica]MCL6220921.1 AAA domain-containing protein [Zunongwangia pacifica]